MQHCLNTQPSLLEAEMFDNRTNLFFFKFLLIFMLSAVLSAPFIQGTNVVLIKLFFSVVIFIHSFNN